MNQNLSNIKFSRGISHLMTFSREKGERVLIPAVGYLCGGLFVHKATGANGNPYNGTWYITHVISGLRLPGHFGTMREATEVAMKLIGIYNWKQPINPETHTSTEMNELGARIREITGSGY